MRLQEQANKPLAVFLDAATMGESISFDELHELCDFNIVKTTDDKDVLRLCQNCSVIVSNKVVFDRAKLQALSGTLQLICLTATGYNNVDVESAREFGVTVCNVRDYSTDSVAQHTLATTLALLQNIGYYHQFVHSGAYADCPVFTHFGHPWYELAGKTWGIIGLGAIGSKVAEIASALGCRILYYSSSGIDRSDQYQRADLDSLLGQSQIVSIHSPLNENTHGLLNATNIKLMRPEAILVNVGRGGIVDESDLAEALNNKIIRGAAVDVFTSEPIQPESPLLKVDSQNILLTPHIAWGSTEARARVISGVAANIKAYFQGAPSNVVS